MFSDVTQHAVHVTVSRCHCFRMFDTAQAYDNEEAVGEAVKEGGVPRDEVFIVSKIHPRFLGYHETLKSVEESLRRLKVSCLYYPHKHSCWIVPKTRKEFHSYSSVTTSARVKYSILVLVYIRNFELNLILNNKAVDVDPNSMLIFIFYNYILQNFSWLLSFRYQLWSCSWHCMWWNNCCGRLGRLIC